MVYLFLLIEILTLASGILVTAEFIPITADAISLKKEISTNISNNDNDDTNSSIQFASTNLSALHNNNSTQITNSSSSSSSTPQEIHKPLSPKSLQEIQKEKEEIQKSKPNTTVFTQRLPLS